MLLLSFPKKYTVHVLCKSKIFTWAAEIYTCIRQLLTVPAQLQVTPRFCQIVAAIPSLPSEIHPRYNIFEEDDNSNNIIKKKVYCMIYHVYDNSIQKIIIL